MFRTIITIITVVPIAVSGIVIVIRLFRPDFLRYELLNHTSDPRLVGPLEARLARLDHLGRAELALLPEDHEELGEVEGARAVFGTARTTLPDGSLEITMTVVVEGPPRLLLRLVYVAVVGFRMGSDGVRHPLTEERSSEIAVCADNSLLH